MAIHGRSSGCLSLLVLLSAGVCQAGEPKANTATEVAVEVRFVRLDPELVKELRGKGLLGRSSKGTSFPLLDDAQMVRFMQAVWADRRSSVMRSPGLTTSSGQQGSVRIVDEQRFVTGLNVSARDGRLVCEEKAEVVPFGVQIDECPVVAADRRSVRLRFSLQWNELASDARRYPITMPAPRQDGYADSSGQTVTYSIEEPQVNRVHLNRTLVIPDGRTAVLIGSTTAEHEQVEDVAVPVLGDLPFVGQYFRITGSQCEPCCLLVLVTPRIRVPREKEEKRSGPMAFEKGPRCPCRAFGDGRREPAVGK